MATVTLHLPSMIPPCHLGIQKLHIPQKNPSGSRIYSYVVSHFLAALHRQRSDWPTASLLFTVMSSQGHMNHVITIMTLPSFIEFGHWRAWSSIALALANIFSKFKEMKAILPIFKLLFILVFPKHNFHNLSIYFYHVISGHGQCRSSTWHDAMMNDMLTTGNKSLNFHFISFDFRVWDTFQCNISFI